MKPWHASLYLRLIIAFVVAIVASFGTMYVLYRHDLDRHNERTLAAILASKVILTQELLEYHAPNPQSKAEGSKIAETPEDAPPPQPDTIDEAARLQGLMADELNRPVVVRATLQPQAGWWINLQIGDSPEQRRGPAQWLFLPRPDRHRPPSSMLSISVLVGLGVFLIGGIGLLWQVQRPLKRLHRALEATTLIGGNQRIVSGASGIAILDRLSQQYNNMVDRLNQLERDRSVMLAGIAHDLRTPITRLRLLTELAHTDRRADFMKSLDQLEGIVDQFLAFTRGVEGEQPACCELNAYVEEVIEPYVHQGLIFKPAASTCQLDLYPNALRRALLNLVENAIEYGAPVQAVRVAITDQKASIVVRDHGPGIPPDQLETAMQPFTRLDAARAGGSHCGLGLVIAKQIAAAHGGGLILRAPGEGSGLEAEIWLPLAALPKR
ncbi:MAG: ATP-binding protein [Burkholderiales bacterium]|nr:ATP-binding protein [Burkholderiales bacterium]